MSERSFAELPAALEQQVATDEEDEAILLAPSPMVAGLGVYFSRVAWKQHHLPRPLQTMERRARDSAGTVARSFRRTGGSAGAAVARLCNTYQAEGERPLCDAQL